MKDQPRHLHESGDTHTLCGRGRSQCHSVHITKARKTDCRDCRAAYRIAVGLRRHRARFTWADEIPREALIWEEKFS